MSLPSTPAPADPSLWVSPAIFRDLGWLVCGMTTRHASPSGDSRRALAARIPGWIGAPGLPVFTVEQIHGDAVAAARPQPGSSPLSEIPGADALVACDGAAVLIGVFTADCVPVVLVDPAARLLGAVHAGREGTRLGITAHTVARLLEMGASAERLRAWIAPSICAAHYEVGAEQAAPFLSRWGNAPGLVGGPARRHLALAAINRRELLDCGLRDVNIELDPRCTLEEPDRFWSYRRDGAGAGRMFTFLARPAGPGRTA